jgi:hypothetical protein
MSYDPSFQILHYLFFFLSLFLCRLSNIDFLEFKTVMNAAKSSWNSNSKWKELLDKANAQAGTAVEIKLFRLNGSGQGVTTYGKTCVAASSTRIGQSANGNDFVLFGKSCFRQGTSYYFSLHEVKDHLLLEGMELARSQTFQCIDSLALIRAQVAAQVARDRAAAKAALRSAQVLAKRRRQIEKDAHDLFTLQRQESEQDLLDRIRARENRSNKRSVPTRQAAVVIDEVFDMIDANGNGKISMSDMKAHINISVPEISTSDVGKMFREADKDKNAQLSKREFREVMVSAKRCCSIPAWNALYASYENRIAPSRSVNKRRRR